MNIFDKNYSEITSSLMNWPLMTAILFFDCNFLKSKITIKICTRRPGLSVYAYNKMLYSIITIEFFGGFNSKYIIEIIFNHLN
jgi:hypothetical protein